MACFLMSLIRLMPNLTKICCNDRFVPLSLEFCYKSTICLKYTLLLFLFASATFTTGYRLLLTDDSPSDSLACSIENTEKAPDFVSSSTCELFEFVRFMSYSCTSPLPCWLDDGCRVAILLLDYYRILVFSLKLLALEVNFIL